MYRQPSLRLRPEVRGTFDEERCRMRLQDIGAEIVPRFLYADGMQEIYAILLGEYGRSQIADVISLLHELLEDDSIEGHVWRSWRYGWRHRNDDLLNPFVPAVEDFVLPPPTRRVIRALRAKNFLRTEAEALPSTVRIQRAHEEHRPSYIPCSSASHSDCGIHPLTTGFEVEHDTSRRSVRERDRDSITDTILRRKRTPEDERRNQFADDERETLFPNWARESSAEQDSLGKLERASHVAVDGLSTRDSQQEFDDVSDNQDDLSVLRFELMTNRPLPSCSPRRTRSDPTDNRLCLRPIHSPTFETEASSHITFSEHGSFENFDWHMEDEEALHDRVETEERHNELAAHSQIPENERAETESHDESGIEQPSDGLGQGTAPFTWYETAIENLGEEFLPDIAYVEDNPRISLSHVRSHTVERRAASITTASDHGSLHSPHSDGLNAFAINRREHGIVNQDVLTLAPREPVSPTPGRFPIDSASEDKISRLSSHKRKLSGQEDAVACEHASFKEPPINVQNERSLESSHASVSGGRRTPQNQLIHRGRRFLHLLPKVFRKECKNKQTTQPSGHTQTDSSIAEGLVRESNKAGRLSRAEGHSSPDLRPKRSEPFPAFDGACDDDDSPSVMSSVDLNKALPPQPLLLNTRGPASRCTGPPSLTFSYKSHTRPSTASTRSSNLSQASSKNRFHRTTHQLVHSEMADSKDLSPLREVDSDRHLVPSKYDPGVSPPVSPKMPDTPMTFSSFNNSNPFMDRYDEFIPPVPAPAIPEFGLPDPVKTPRSFGIPQSRSEGQIYSPKPFQVHDNASSYNFSQSDGPIDHDMARARGRTVSRDIPPMPEIPSRVDEKAAPRRNESRKRSRSPVKRFLRIGKSQSMKEIPNEKESKDESDKKAGLKLWSDRLRHGFLTNTESKVNINITQPEISQSSSSTPTKSTFPISIPPVRQAKLHCELELMLVITANKFLKSQHAAGLMSPESVSKITYQWRHKNRPQVIEFQFDQATQRDLILYNINSFRFHGEARTNPLVLNATMYAWKVMAKEMGVRTFCTPDSVIRKHLHDTHKVLEMLGAGLTTFLTLQELQVEALKEIAEMQKKRVERQRKREKEAELKEREKERSESFGVGVAVTGNGNATPSGSAKTRNFTPPTPKSFMSAPMSSFNVDEETLFEDPYEG